jgi:hypothetical protein
VRLWIQISVVGGRGRREIIIEPEVLCFQNSFEDTLSQAFAIFSLCEAWQPQLLNQTYHLLLARNPVMRSFEKWPIPRQFLWCEEPLSSLVYFLMQYFDYLKLLSLLVRMALLVHDFQLSSTFMLLPLHSWRGIFALRSGEQLWNEQTST